MLFNSFEFLAFLPIVFCCYWFVFKPLRWQNVFVVLASYIFYGWWDWRFLLLIAFTTLCSYASGRMMEKGGKRMRKAVCAANVVVNLGVLGVFKYYNFFAASLMGLFASMGVHLDWVTINLVLPIGISFYTFQAISYTIDLYREKIGCCKDIVAFFAFVSFFPQLVAGPIEKASNLLPQFQQPRRFDYGQAVDGMRQMLWGFFKKLVVADGCATVVNPIFANPSGYDGMELLYGAVLFTFQVYGDFSGYSDIAIGCAKLFGIRLMRNFNVPYFSRNMSEFWRRWHISLMSWLRDYVYFPLGGSRCSKAKTIRNVIIVLLVSGLWHGAAWHFVAWGLYHGLLLAALILIGSTRYRDTVAEGRMLPNLREIGCMAATFAFTVLGRVLYRCADIKESMHYLARLVTDFHLHIPTMGKKVVVYIIILMIVEWVQRTRNHALEISGEGIMRYRLVRWGVYWAIAAAIIVLTETSEVFIYFQF